VLARFVALDFPTSINRAGELVTKDHRDASFVTGSGILSANVEPLLFSGGLRCGLC
jgi:hypothetical protein